MLGRFMAFLYGVACYFIFLATFVYAIGFIGNFAVPKSIDSGPLAPLSQALLVNTVLLGIFALQHSVMARQWFKSAWTRIVPTPVERSTYVLFSSVSLLLLFWKWQPMGGTIWHIDNAAAKIIVYAAYALGWLTILVTTFLIDHFDLFGLRQVWLHLAGRPYTTGGFRSPGPYRFVRHPLYFGWLLVFWSAPAMTAAHLFFAIATTAYILIAIQFEERDLVKFHSEYAQAPRAYAVTVRFFSAPTSGDSTRPGSEAGGIVEARGRERHMLTDITEAEVNSQRQFRKYRGLLHFLATRVLDGQAGAEQAVANCFTRSVRIHQSFDSEGEYRAWLFKTLIQEALHILHEKRVAARTKGEQCRADDRRSLPFAAIWKLAI